MTAIWSDKGTGWKLLSPTGFPDEATLHTLVEESPQLLPLSGSPDLVVVGREVQLGPGYADLVAIEPDGRVAIIEIRLAKNSEARRAVVSQVLAYAAHLHGLAPAELEEGVLGSHLSKRRFKSLAHALESSDQQGSFSRTDFQEGLESHLRDGSFRLVIVLDSAPQELVRLVGYLGTVAERVIVDLVTVSPYEIGGSKILVPQRVDPGHHDNTETPTIKLNVVKGQETEGADAFIAGMENAAPDVRAKLDQLVQWAQNLEAEGLVTLNTYKGVLNRWTLLPWLQPYNSGLVTIWHDQSAALQFWRSMFEKCVPDHIGPIEKKLGITIGQGNTCREFDAEALDLLTDAYRVAASSSR